MEAGDPRNHSRQPQRLPHSLTQEASNYTPSSSLRKSPAGSAPWKSAIQIPPKQAPKPPESQGTYRLPLGMKVILKQTRSSHLPSLRAGNVGDWHTFRGTASGGAQPGPRGQRAGGSPQRCQELSCASGPDQSRLGSCGWSCLPGSVLVFCWPQLCRQSPDKASTWRTKEAGRRGSARDATGWSP